MYYKNTLLITLNKLLITTFTMSTILGLNRAKKAYHNANTELIELLFRCKELEDTTVTFHKLDHAQQMVDVALAVYCEILHLHYGETWSVAFPHLY